MIAFTCRGCREFLWNLDSWEKGVSERPGFEESVKLRMLLSQKTLTGLQMTSLVGTVLLI